MVPDPTDAKEEDGGWTTVKSRRRPKKRPKSGAQSVIRTRAAAVREATEKASRAATEKASKADSERVSCEEPECDTSASRAEVDSPEVTMTVEEWSTEPEFKMCSVCAGPSEGYGYCTACRKFNNCEDCAASAISSRHYAGGVCAYEERWRILGSPRFEQ